MSRTGTAQPSAPSYVSQRRLTIGLCTNIVAIAFETVAVATATAAYVSLDPTVFAGVRWLKVVSGTSQSTTDTIVRVAGWPV